MENTSWTETGTIQGVSLVHIFHTLPVLPLMIPRHTTYTHGRTGSECRVYLFFQPRGRERETEKENHNWKMGRRRTVEE